MSVPAELALASPHPSRQAGLWLGAGAAVLAAHLAFAYMLRGFDDFAPMPEAVEQSMEIDLTPLPISAPEAVATETLSEETVETLQPVEEMVDTVEPEVSEAEPAPVEEMETAEAEPETLQPETETLETEAVEPETVEPEMVEVQPERPVEPEPEVVASEVVEPALPEAAPQPQARPVEQPPKKVEQPARRQQARKPPAEKTRKTRAAETGKKTDVKPSASSTASKASTAPKVNPARWHSQVRAAVARRVGRIRGKSGTVNVRFIVNGSGAVVSASVARSSGDGSLDSAALNAVRSARVPAPPEGLGGQHSFSIPLTFR